MRDKFFGLAMHITSWNINSLKARRDHVERYLAESSPDVLMVQELKGVDFPNDDFMTLGYHTAAVTQKTYNGVAVFSKTPIKVLSEALKGDDNDEQARFIDFETNGVRLMNVYCPNGNPIGTEKYEYKLSWMARLKIHLEGLIATQTPFIIGGDFNVIPDPKDCYDPSAWADDALFRLDTQKAFRPLLNLSLYDAFRIFNNRPAQYTFWDYQAGAWPKNNGIRIDHFLLSPHMVDRALNCIIDSAPRGWDRPSDHTPITLEIS